MVGVGGSNPLGRTNLTLCISAPYATSGETRSKKFSYFFLFFPNAWQFTRLNLNGELMNYSPLSANFKSDGDKSVSHSTPLKSSPFIDKSAFTVTGATFSWPSM